MLLAQNSLVQELYESQGVISCTICETPDLSLLIGFLDEHVR